jgi:hypothetical protein
VEVIHVAWEGPLTLDEARGLHDNADYGLYQVYGNHTITGPHTLLYVGKANDTTFGARLTNAAHEWLPWETDSLRIHVGRVAIPEDGPNPTDDEWSRMIGTAEALTIFFCTPAYNSHYITNLHHADSGIVIVNHLRRGRIPACISNLGEINHPNGGGLGVIHPGRAPGTSNETVEDDAFPPRH